LATFSPLDVDRIVTLYKAARATGRTFVADTYTAFVLHLIGRRVKVPKPARESGIRVYFNALFERRSLPTIREKFEADRIELSEILAEPQKYVMAFRPSMTGFDFGGQLPSRCRCLYGYWAGYLTRPDWVTLQDQVAKAGGDFIRAHVSGHAYVADIVRFVTAVNARTVIPIHTFEPQMFEDHFPNVTRLADAVPFDLP
jgi:ribonuclease J